MTVLDLPIPAPTQRNAAPAPRPITPAPTHAEPPIQPHNPTPAPTSTDSLFTDYLNPRLTLEQLAARHNLSIPDLLDRLASDSDLQSRLTAAHHHHALRIRILATAQLPLALQVLAAICHHFNASVPAASTAPPDPQPALAPEPAANPAPTIAPAAAPHPASNIPHRASSETARKAANALHKLADFHSSIPNFHPPRPLAPRPQPLERLDAALIPTERPRKSYFNPAPPAHPAHAAPQCVEFAATTASLDPAPAAPREEQDQPTPKPVPVALPSTSQHLNAESTSSPSASSAPPAAPRPLARKTPQAHHHRRQAALITISRARHRTPEPLSPDTS